MTYRCCLDYKQHYYRHYYFQLSKTGIYRNSLEILCIPEICRLRSLINRTFLINYNSINSIKIRKVWSLWRRQRRHGVTTKGLKIEHTGKFTWINIVIKFVRSAEMCAFHFNSYLRLHFRILLAFVKCVQRRLLFFLIFQRLIFNFFCRVHLDSTWLSGNIKERNIHHSISLHFLKDLCRSSRCLPTGFVFHAMPSQ